MTVIGLAPEPKLLTPKPPSKTVNIFDLTAKIPSDTTHENFEILSPKERAARVIICVILSMVVLTAVSLLLGEVFGLQWRLSSQPHNRTSTLPHTWYEWPAWHWRHGQSSNSLPLSGRGPENYQEHWNTLTFSEKRKELLGATLGEVDLYDVYDDTSKDVHLVNTNKNVE